MGKLKFKGDKPKKKRIREEEMTSSGTSKKKLDIRADAVSGWTSCAGPGDLNGPFIVLTEEQGKVFCLELDGEDSEWKRGNAITASEEPANFVSSTGSDELDVAEGPYPEIHCVEPTSVCQTLVFVPISHNSGSSVASKAPDRFAFKCYNGRYLTVNPKSLAMETGFTITQYATFKLQAVEESTLQLSRWRISLEIEDKSYYLGYRSGRFQFAENGDNVGSNTDFVIRIQTPNSAAVKLNAIREQEEEQTDIKKIVADLKRDTKGKIQISGELIRRLQKSKKDGYLNDQIIEEKTKVLSKW